jgi:hypothetical protein
MGQYFETATRRSHCARRHTRVVDAFEARMAGVRYAGRDCR